MKKQEEKGKERKSSGRNALRKQHNVKLSSWLIFCSVGSHVAVGGLTLLSPWTLAQFPFEPFGLANFS